MVEVRQSRCDLALGPKGYRHVLLVLVASYVIVLNHLLFSLTEAVHLHTRHCHGLCERIIASYDKIYKHLGSIFLSCYNWMLQVLFATGTLALALALAQILSYETDV